MGLFIFITLMLRAVETIVVNLTIELGSMIFGDVGEERHVWSVGVLYN